MKLSFSCKDFEKYENKSYSKAIAHKTNKKVETLKEHSCRSLKVLMHLMKDINIPYIYKKGLLFATYFHDFGKLNKNFQIEKMGNISYKEDKEFQNKIFSTIKDDEKILTSTNHSRFNNIFQ
jgi:CRISPR/Cas system-associated endonuclease Cas3-HD